MFPNFPFGHKVRKEGRAHNYFRRGDQNAQRKGKLRRHSEEGTKRGRYNSTIFALCDVLDFVKKFTELDNAISDFIHHRLKKRCL